MKDFFISYNKADLAWAEWIAWQLEDVGFTTIIQEWDFLAGSNFVVNMQKAAAEATRTIAVLSPDYLAARYTQPEWAAAFAQDPTGEKGTLLPVRVRKCEINGLWSQIVYIDLVDRPETQAKETLLAKVRTGRAKPMSPRRFPGLTTRPSFPGPTNIASASQSVGQGTEQPPPNLAASGGNPGEFERIRNDPLQGAKTVDNTSKSPENRSVSIGGNVSGSVIQTGDHNTAMVNYRQETGPLATNVDIHAELTALRDLLLQIETPDRRKISNALEDAEVELSKPQPDKNEIGSALSRALGYAKQATDFAKVVETVAPHVVNAAGWLGREWGKLLKVIGIGS